MGGYAFDTSLSNLNFLHGGRTRVTLDYKDLIFLATNEPSLLPELSREQIEDKSKASSLAKTLVCLQALWFCLQCISRLSDHLPISLLEINTFAHALCTLIIYLMWWYKPQGIDEPSLIQGEAMERLCALLSNRLSPYLPLTREHPDSEHARSWPVRKFFSNALPYDITDIVEDQ